MRRTVRVSSEQSPQQRLARTIASMPAPAQQALRQVADRDDLPLVAGTWGGDAGGCLVANVVAAMSERRQPELADAAAGRGSPASAATLDVRILELIPELGSRDLNRLIVAWDEAAVEEGRVGDAALRRLLREALDRAGVGEGERSRGPGPGPVPVPVPGSDRGLCLTAAPAAR